MSRPQLAAVVADVAAARTRVAARANAALVAKSPFHARHDGKLPHYFVLLAASLLAFNAGMVNCICVAGAFPGCTDRLLRVSRTRSIPGPEKERRGPPGAVSLCP